MKNKKVLIVSLIILIIVIIISFIVIKIYKDTNSKDGMNLTEVKLDNQIDISNLEKIKNKKYLKDYTKNDIKITDLEVRHIENENYIIFNFNNLTNNLIKADYFEVSLYDKENELIITLNAKLEKDLNVNEFEKVIIINNEFKVEDINKIEFNFDSINT